MDVQTKMNKFRLGLYGNNLSFKINRKSYHACNNCMAKALLICSTWTEIIAIILCTALFITVAIILVYLWLEDFKQGVFNLNGPTATFSPYNYMNRHALYMVLACIGFASFAVVPFRMMFFCHYILKLFLHIVLLIMATVFMILGYNYIHTAIATSGIPDGEGGVYEVTHYCLHSILGYITFGLYAAACVMGFLVFKPPCKALFRGMHHGLGAVAYACGGLTVISGFTLRQQIQFGIAYIPYFSKECIWADILQILIVVAVVLVLFMLARKEMKDVHSIIVPDSDI